MFYQPNSLNFMNNDFEDENNIQKIIKLNMIVLIIRIIILRIRIIMTIII